MDSLSKISSFFSCSGTLICGHISKALNFLYIETETLRYLASIVWISFEERAVCLSCIRFWEDEIRDTIFLPSSHGPDLP